MVYSPDWITKIVTIPVSDLTLVSGTRYSLDMADFLAECRRLEWAFADGLWAPAILDHGNTRVDFAGADYAPFDEVTNGYTVEFGAGPTRVDLLGSNNNIVDVLIPTGISVVPSNSAGLQRVETGTSGLTAEESAQLSSISTIVTLLNKYVTSKREMRKIGATWYLIIYDTGQSFGGTEVLRKHLTDKEVAEITDLPAGVVAIEEETSV